MDPASRVPRWLPPVVGLAALAWMLHAWLPATALLSQAAADRQDLLRGTWLREYRDGGVQVRRLLSLHAGGTFRESVHVVEPAGTVTDFEHQGTWLYDGTNLKRRYTLVNGKPPSRLNLPFATFEIAFDSRNAFTGIDHIHGHRIEYHRVALDAGAD